KKDLIARARQLKEKIEQLKVEEQAEERKGNLQRGAEIRYGLIRQTEEELAKVTAQMDGKPTLPQKARKDGAAGDSGNTGKSDKSVRPTQTSPARMLKEEVDEEDIAKLV